MEIDPSQAGAEVPNGEIIQLNQEFALFDAKRVIVKKHIGGGAIPTGSIRSVESEVQLCLPGMQSTVPITAGADLNNTLYRYFGATPFDEEIGATVSPEDFDIELRIKKWAELRKKRIEKLGEIGANLLNESIEPKAPLCLAVMMSRSIWNNPKFIIPEFRDTRGYQATRFKSEIVDALQGLNLTLIFPRSLWSGVPGDFDENQRLGFYYFHPLGTPTLAVAPDREWNKGGSMEKGLSLFVPDDVDKLGLIKGVFSKFK